MVDWTTYALLGSQLLMWAVFIVIGWFIKKQYTKTLESTEEPSILEGLTEVFNSFSQSVADQIKNEIHGKDTQKMLTQTSVNAIASLMSTEENQTLIANFMMESFAAVIEEMLPQIMQQTTGISPLSEAQAKKMDEKTTGALGALAANAADELLPPGVGLVLGRLWPDWQDQAQNNPREFMQVIAKAKEWGLFDMFSGLAGSLTPSTANKSTTRTPITF